MNINHLSDIELLHYLDLTSNDPLVRRLVDMLSATRGGIISDLVEAGMDPNTGTFTEDYQDYYPGDYITHLQKMYNYEAEDRAILEDERDELKKEVERLGLRSITEVLAEAQRAVNHANANVSSITRHATKVDDENRELREKLGMWNIMKTE